MIGEEMMDAPKRITRLLFVILLCATGHTVEAQRGGTGVPLTLAILIQDDLVSSIANEISGLAQFIRRLPPNSRVLVGYLRSGSLQVRQRFTSDLERAARALRI